MDEYSNIKKNTEEFKRLVGIWNAGFSADIDLYDFFRLADGLLDMFGWIKSSLAAGLPITTSGNVDEAIFDFADQFMERWERVQMSIILTGRNSKDEMVATMTGFVSKLIDISGDYERVEHLFEVNRQQQKERLEKIRAEAEASRERNRRWDELFNNVMRLRSEAKNLEMAGDLDGACLKLEEAVAFGQTSGLGPSTYLAAMERLFILYRKLKRYADEERVLLAAISIERARNHPICDRRANKYEERLAKCKALLDKSNAKRQF